MHSSFCLAQLGRDALARKFPVYVTVLWRSYSCSCAFYHGKVINYMEETLQCKGGLLFTDFDSINLLTN